MNWQRRVVILLALWCLGAGAVNEPAAPRSTPVVSCLFSIDGSLLFVAHQNLVAIHSTKDGKIEGILKARLPRITAMALGPSGRLLAVGGGTAGESGEVLLVDWEQDRVLSKVEGFDDLVTAVAFSADGARLGVASADRTGRCLAIKESDGRAESIAQLIGHAGPVLSIAFSPDGKELVTGSTDRSLKVWDAAIGKLLRSLNNHTGAVQCLAVRLEKGVAGRAAQPFTCASGSDDHTVRIWQPEIGRMVRIIRLGEERILALAYSPDGTVLLAAGAGGVVRVIDAQSDQILHLWRAHGDWIYALAVNRDGRYVVSGDWAGQVRLWQIDGHSARQIW